MAKGESFLLLKHNKQNIPTVGHNHFGPPVLHKDRSQIPGHKCTKLHYKTRWAPWSPYFHVKAILSLALPIIRNIHLMSSLNYKTSFSHVIALYKVLHPPWHLLPTCSVTSNGASSVLILVGKVSLYHLPAVRQVWPWLTFCVMLQPEIPLESQIPGLHTISSEGPPTPSYTEATLQMKHLRDTFAFF